MSKIPQGEWNAIAARYQNGESISKIARSYGCTPPAIHYILKRNRQRPAATLLPAELVRSVEPAQSQLVRATPPDPVPARVAHAQKMTNGIVSQLLHASSIGSTPHAPLAATSTLHTAPPKMPLRTPAPQPGADETRSAVSGGLPGLTGELHLRAEAAIELFRSSFDAALVEGSADVRERLRQAATDLMRVAARTTIVLDRLNANAERAARSHNYPRSAHAGDDLGKLG
jgi:transposase-like protein